MQKRSAQGGSFVGSTLNTELGGERNKSRVSSDAPLSRSQNPELMSEFGITAIVSSNFIHVTAIWRRNFDREGEPSHFLTARSEQNGSRVIEAVVTLRRIDANANTIGSDRDLVESITFHSRSRELNGTERYLYQQ